MPGHIAATTESTIYELMVYPVMSIEKAIMPTTHHECDNCDAVFRIKYDMDDHYYRVSHCPFCGEQLDQEDNYDIEEE